VACENPIYIRPHTKTVLSLALSNDSRFLASQMVMDYSLLVGLDEKKSELDVGIIGKLSATASFSSLEVLNPDFCLCRLYKNIYMGQKD